MKKFSLKKPSRLLKKERTKRRRKCKFYVGQRLDDGSYIAKICYTPEERRRYLRKLMGV